MNMDTHADNCFWDALVPLFEECRYLNCAWLLLCFERISCSRLVIACPCCIHLFFKLRVLTAYINELCFWVHSCFFLRLRVTELDLYVAFLYARFFTNLCVVRCVWWRRGFLLPPSSCCVFDIISVSFYFGLPIWICMYLLNIRFVLKSTGWFRFCCEICDGSHSNL